jgi:hypothetical protein
VFAGGFPSVRVTVDPRRGGDKGQGAVIGRKLVVFCQLSLMNWSVASNNTLRLMMRLSGGQQQERKTDGTQARQTLSVRIPGRPCALFIRGRTGRRRSGARERLEGAPDASLNTSEEPYAISSDSFRARGDSQKGYEGTARRKSMIASRRGSGRKSQHQ